MKKEMNRSLKVFNDPSLSNFERSLLAIILLLIILLMGLDLLTDLLEGVKWSHLIIEMSIVLGASFGHLFLMRESFRKSRKLIHSNYILVEKDKEIERWKNESQKYIQGLGKAIDAQLNRWSLTPSEKEVAFFLLKGLSFKEIAEIRQTSEKTVRTQSVSLYSKAGLAGRSELSAFFLEDLFLG